MAYIRTWIMQSGIFLMLCCFASSHANASSLAKTKSLYFTGKLAPAEKAALQALRRPANRATKAEIYKTLGMTQYTLGKRANAAKAFSHAKKLNPRIRINANEALDGSVIAYFNSIPGGTSNAPTRTTRAPLNPKATAPKPVRKGTSITIKSNIGGASVSFDGIIAGQTNYPIDADAGRVLVEVSKPGYRKVRSQINVKPNRSNVFAINLKPSAKPRVKTQPKLKQQSKPRPQRQANDMFSAPKARVKLKQAPNSLAAEFNSDGARQPARRKVIPRQPQPNVQPQPSYRPQPAYPQPVYPQPVYPQPVYPQPVYPQPTYPPQPTYQVQPVYPQPVPVVPMQPYAQPAPQPPVVIQEPSPPEPFIEPGPPSRPKSYFPKRKKKKRPRKKAKSSGSIVFALMPFGVGQFQNGDYILGSLLGIGQAAGIYLYIEGSQRATQLQAEAEADSAAIQAQIDQETNETATEELVTLGNDRATSFDAARKDASQRSQAGMITFLGLWAASSVEAIMNQSSTSRKKRKKKFSYGPLDDTQKAIAEEHRVQKSKKYTFYLQPDLIANPAHLRQEDFVKPTLQTGILIEF